ncbi:MAG: hypothetical protein QNI86_12685, partial [Halieaceae bacterium]|nr:hypothetical protein [Halieaceae bacterium]
MNLPSLRTAAVTLLKVVAALFVLFYLLGVYITLQPLDPAEKAPIDDSGPRTIILFGASGTAGDGILSAAMADPQVETIHVITRRSTPRIERGVASGKVEMTKHMDYLDYSALHEIMAEAHTVYWAIGISAMGVDEETYGRIHVDFPAQFLKEWLSVASDNELSFQFISSSDISEDSDTMWVREKIRAEKTLFSLAEDTGLRVIAHRPDYIRPAQGEAHLGQKLMYWFFRPVGAAVQSEEIGQAMLEVTVRGSQFDNGSKLG